MQAGHGNALASLVDILGAGLRVAPVISGASVQKHRHEEQVDQTACNLKVIGAIFPPLIGEVLDARLAANLEVLPSSVRRDLVVAVRAKVTLSFVSAPLPSPLFG